MSAKMAIKKGTASKIVRVAIRNSASTTGALKTGLVAGNIKMSYHREGASAPVAVTTITALTVAGGTAPNVGTYYPTSGANAAFGPLSSTLMLGWYEVHLPNDALIPGADSVGFEIIDVDGTHDIAPLSMEFQLVAYDPNAYVLVGATGKVTMEALDDDIITAAKIANNAIDAATFAADAKLKVRKNQDLAQPFPFIMFDSATKLPAAFTRAGNNLAVQRSINGADFANIATPTSADPVGTAGLHKCTLTAADLNGDFIILKYTATGAETRFERIVTTP